VERKKKYIVPHRRKKKWASMSIRAEHYMMLKELDRFYKGDTPVTKIVGTLIVKEFLRVLEELDPEKAKDLREAYKDERHIDHILDLPD